MINKPIKVLIIDDSVSIRVMLENLLSKGKNIEIVGSAENPIEADKMIIELNPDIITLDVEMPQMDGLTYLKQLKNEKRLDNMAVVMISTLTQKGSDIAVKCYELGAVEVIGKPSAKGSSLGQIAEEILTKVYAAAASLGLSSESIHDIASLINPKNDNESFELELSPNHSIDTLLPFPKIARPISDMPIIAIGSSTGGPHALSDVLSKLPKETPPVVIAQHMPPHFTKSFANRLNDLSALTVVEVSDKCLLEPGHAYVCAGGKHLTVVKGSDNYYCRATEGHRINRHRPSVDVLFRSVQIEFGQNAIAVMLTGMGDDGAKCMKELHDAGAFTIAQSEETCTVYGMPRAAVELGGVNEIVALHKIADKLKEKTERAKKWHK